MQRTGERGPLIFSVNRYSNNMRAIPFLLACLLFCGCERAPAERPADKETPPVNKDKLDLFKVSDLVFNRYATVGYGELSRPEKVFVCVWGLEGEVNNGGFDQYYFNSSGDHALDTIESLEAIDAKHTANLVRDRPVAPGIKAPGAKGPSPACTSASPTKEPVSVGHYGQSHRPMTAAEAVALFSGGREPRGLGGHRPAPHRGEGDPPGTVVAPSRRLAVLSGCQGQAAVLHLQVLHQRGLRGAGSRQGGAPDG